jgi:hypothetical protein
VPLSQKVSVEFVNVRWINGVRAAEGDTGVAVFGDGTEAAVDGGGGMGSSNPPAEDIVSYWYRMMVVVKDNLERVD